MEAVLLVQLINAIFMCLLPVFYALATCFIGFGMSIYVLFLVLSYSFALTCIATELLKGQRNKNGITHKTLAVLAYLVGIVVLLKDIYAMVTRHTESDKVIHTIITTHTDGSDMMNVQRSPVLFWGLPALLANLVPFTNSLSSFIPFISIIHIATSIVPMVLAFQPLVEMFLIDEECISFIAFDAMRGMEHLLTTSTCTFYFSAWLTLGFANLCLCCFGMLASSVHLNSSDAYAFLGSARGLFASACDACFKCFAANNACFLCTFVGIITCSSAELAVNLAGVSPERLVAMETDQRDRIITHGKHLSFATPGDAGNIAQATLYYIINYTINPPVKPLHDTLGLRLIRRELGYDPDEELALSQAEDAQKLEDASQAQQVMAGTPITPGMQPEMIGQEPGANQQGATK